MPCMQCSAPKATCTRVRDSGRRLPAESRTVPKFRVSLSVTANAFCSVARLVVRARGNQLVYIVVPIDVA